jgi:hypothetical protein
MNKHHLKLIALALIAISSLVLLTACHSRKMITVNGMLNNQTKGTAYMWLGHKEKPEPTDLLGPGEFKPIMISLNAYMDDDTVEEIEDLVKANGSNDGTTVVHDDLSVAKTFTGGGNLYVRWNGSQLSLGY